MIGTNYRVIRELGRGGEGRVYLVQHLVTEQYRAAKVLDHVTGDRRFQEIHAMKRLEHPSLPQIFDVIIEGERIWLILEYIRGRCLHEIPRQEVCPEQFFLIAGQLAEVLLYLHTRAAPVFHLDIKPSNLILQADGRLVLIDFGAALHKDELQRQTKCFGTPGFAAPEQFQKGTADGRSDIYGAGAVLYYYLFRTTPDRGQSLTAEMKSLEKAGNRFWREEAVGLISQCLARDPDQRFVDTTTFSRAVKRAENRYKVYKNLKSTAAAALFLGVVVWFAAHQFWHGSTETEVQELQKKEMQKQQQYQLILDQADQLGFEQAVVCYKEAAELFPEYTDWVFHLLERITDDYSFTLEEEQSLKELLYRPAGKTVNQEGRAQQPEQSTALETEQNIVLELLRQQEKFYGEFAYELGIAYWYYYEETGGKRAAFQWFSQAVEAGRQQEQNGESVGHWLELARIHAKIGTYYEKLGKVDANGIQRASMVIYWEDLEKLWGLEEGADSLIIQKQLAEELLSCMILHGYELSEQGKDPKEFQEILRQVEVFAEKNPQLLLEEQCEAAGAAIQRISDRQNGEQETAKTSNSGIEERQSK